MWRVTLYLLFLSAAFHLSGGALVTQEFNNGSYLASVDGVTWLQSAPTFFRANGQVYSMEDKSLVFLHHRTVTGNDRVGFFTSNCYDFRAEEQEITTCVRKYGGSPLAIYQQTYTNGASGTSTGRDKDSIIGGFPYFQLSQTQSTIGYMSFGGSMFGADIKYGKLTPNAADMNYGVTGGPLVLFGDSGNVMILAPFSEFMAASVYHNKADKTFGWGVMGGVDSVPHEYEYETILYYSDAGINKAMSDWGDFMRGFYEKDDSFRRSDLTLTHLGYWTDGGAYYYYNTEPGKTYEQTILDVWDYSKRVNLPTGTSLFVQYDSYFYFKGLNDGVKTWSPMPDLFPDGFDGMYEKTGWPAAAHNRWWSPQTTYAKQNGGDFEFIIDSGKAIPTEEEFWDFLFDTSKEWGLILYEQDWLDVEFAGLNATLTDIDLGKSWLLQMGRSAMKNGLTIQYCMSNPRHAMQSLEIPVVTQARVSGDYRAGADNWKIGPQSLFADAMGIAPFKDNFWSSRVQPGNPKYPNLQETHAELQAMVATLSTGPVAPGDMINATNVTMLMQCCNADGLILKPTRPAMAINAQIIQRALSGGGPDGEIYTTYSQIGAFSFGIVLAADLKSNYVLTPNEAGFQEFAPKVIFSRLLNGATTVLPFADPGTGLTLGSECSKTSPCLYYTSPVFMIGQIYGETDKFVPMSPQRVTNIVTVSNTDIEVTLEGAQGEGLNFVFIQRGTLVSIFCTIGDSGSAILSLEERRCRPF